MDLNKTDIYYPQYQEPTGDVSAVAFGIIRLSDGKMYDFSGGEWKSSGWATQYQAMTESQNGLWIYTPGWTTPNTKAIYKVQLKITDPSGSYYTDGDLLNVTDIVQQVVSTTSTPSTTQERLNAVRAAINAIITGGAVQSYQVDGVNINKFSLTELMELEDRLKRQLAAGQTRKTYVQFEDP